MKRFPIFLVAISLLFSSAFFVSIDIGNSNATSGPVPICTLPNKDPAGGVYYSRTPDINISNKDGGSQTPGTFVIDGNDGDIYFCDTSDQLMPTSIPSVQGSFSALAGWDTWYFSNVTSYNPANGILTMIEVSDSLQGMNVCYHANMTSCQGGDVFFSFPPSYCSQFQLGCQPSGVALDANSNLYWIDSLNSVFTECFAPRYKFCTTLIGASEFDRFGPVKPYGLALLNGTGPYMTPGWQFYITDASCSGFVWRTSAQSNWSLTEIAKVSNSLTGIGSGDRGTLDMYQQVFVGDANTCSGGGQSKIVDVSEDPIQLKFSGEKGARIFLTSCVGQCLGYREPDTLSKIGMNGYQMFFSAGDQSFVAAASATSKTSVSSSSTASTTYTTVSVTEFVTSVVPTTVTYNTTNSYFTTVNITNTYNETSTILSTQLVNVTQILNSTSIVNSTFTITTTVTNTFDNYTTSISSNSTS